MRTRCTKFLLALGALAVCGMATMPMAQAAPQGEAAQPAAAATKPKNRVPGPASTPAAWPGGTVVPKGSVSIVNHVTYSEGEPLQGQLAVHGTQPQNRGKSGATQ